MVARHDKYYFKDGDVVFQVSGRQSLGVVLCLIRLSGGVAKVGEKLYRIHERMLVGSESSVFTTMFSLPRRQNTEGKTDATPIVLEKEDPEQFEALMRILYPT